MIEIDFEQYLETKSAEVTHYVMWGSVQGGGVRQSTYLVNAERFERLKRYDQAGTIRANFDVQPIDIEIAPLPNPKGNQLNEYASREFQFMASQLGLAINMIVHE